MVARETDLSANPQPQSPYSVGDLLNFSQWFLVYEDGKSNPCCWGLMYGLNETTNTITYNSQSPGNDYSHYVDKNPLRKLHKGNSLARSQSEAGEGFEPSVYWGRELPRWYQ